VINAAHLRAGYQKKNSLLIAFISNGSIYHKRVTVSAETDTTDWQSVQNWLQYRLIAMLQLSMDFW
jgi:hypothetical protein